MILKKFLGGLLVTSLFMTVTLPTYAEEGNIIHKGEYSSYQYANTSKTYKASTNSRNKDVNFSIAENINAFSSDDFEGYTKAWSETSDEGSNEYVNMYGVVNGYYNNDDSDVWVLEMQSNIRGVEDTYINWLGNFDTRVSAIEKFKWRVWKSGGDFTIIKWAPSGSSVATYGGYPIDVSIEPSYKGATLGSIGTSFTILQDKDTLNSFADNSSYSVEFTTTKPLKYPLTQDLKATVAFEAPNYCEWQWSWSWTSRYWY